MLLEGVLLAAGLTALIAAAIGGGISGAGFSFPANISRSGRAYLAVIAFACLAAAIAVGLLDFSADPTVPAQAQPPSSAVQASIPPNPGSQDPVSVRLPPERNGEGEPEIQTRGDCSPVVSSSTISDMDVKC